jgi:regulator of protease activity HflC (stomatin/prohibitin superfamily)
MFSELPRFNKASRYRVPLLVGGAVLASVGAALIGAVWAHTTFGWFSGLPGPAALSYLGAALSVAAAGLVCAAMLTIVRHRSLTVESQPDSRPVRRRRVPASPQMSETGWDLPGRLLAWLWSLVPPRPPMADWPHVLVAALMGMVAIIGVWVGWRISVPPTVNAIALQVLAGSFAVTAFVLLVLERLFANIDAEELPEAPQIDRLLRVPLTGCLALGIASVIQSLGFAWAQRIEQVFAVVVAAVALELVLRGAAFVFIPFAPLEQRRSVADSSMAGLLRLAVPNFHAFNTAVQRQFGIDLSRSWALAFVQRAAVPIALGMAVMAWGITGMTALGINQRAVYERFGVPVQVMGPGLHIHLPWPMGVMREVELGVIHDIPIAFAPPSGARPTLQTSAGVDQQQQMVGAEALPPVSADRLWDASHPSEQSYLIASETRGEQSFQVVDADLRIVYRIGLSDEAALHSAYRVEGPENLIRATAGQLLVRYFSRYTLADVLGQSREAFANEFRGALQNELDGLSSGIEAIAVVVEAIHPPPGAASAYQYVQASEILSKSTISIRRAEAIRALKSAGQYALEDRARAEAAAAELVNQARSESVLFEADRKAHQRDSGSFLLERRFARLVNGLSRSEFIVIDHRAAAKNGPFIDLRSFEGGAGGQFGRRDFGFPPGPPGVPGRNPASEDDDDRYR